MDQLGRETYTVHSISAQTRQERMECTKAKEYLRSHYPNLYTVVAGVEFSMSLAHLESSAANKLYTAPKEYHNLFKAVFQKFTLIQP
jgi:hypothetical protein